jgi:hypothetical protein
MAQTTFLPEFLPEPLTAHGEAPPPGSGAA